MSTEFDDGGERDEFGLEPPDDDEPKSQAVSNADDICARPKCLSPRHYNIHDPERGGHAFVEPDPMCGGCKDCKPAPSGDEAKVLEIADKYEKSRDAFGHFGRSSVHELAKEAYAAGKADGAREERNECELTVRDSCICQGAECVCSAWLRDIARAIARRGSEGK